MGPGDLTYEDEMIGTRADVQKHLRLKYAKVLRSECVEGQNKLLAPPAERDFSKNCRDQTNTEACLCSTSFCHHKIGSRSLASDRPFQTHLG